MQENGDIFYKVYTYGYNGHGGKLLPSESVRVSLAEWLKAAKELGHACSYVARGMLEYPDSKSETGTILIDEAAIIVRRDCRLDNGNWSECIRLA